MSFSILSKQRYNQRNLSWIDPASYGLSSANPALSATDLKNRGITQNGNYYLSIGFSNATIQAYVNFTYAGGPYILAMQIKNSGTEWAYDSTIWTSNTSAGSTLAIDPQSNTNQISQAFYSLPTSRTGLAFHLDVPEYFNFIDHSSANCSALAQGAAGALTAVTPSGATIQANVNITGNTAAIANGWFNGAAAGGFTKNNLGSTYYRYGWQHGVPDPSGFGYARFGWTADQDASDSRDRFLGIGIKNGGSGPLGSFSASAGGGNYAGAEVDNIRAFLYIKN
jgi:hypothetical protein